MANYYVYSGAGGAANGTSWANAYTTLALAIAGSVAAGDTIYVAHDHAESTSGTVTLSFPGTFASPNRVLCVNRAGSVPPVAADLTTGAEVATTGANNLTLTSVTAGAVYYYGMRFEAGSGTNNANVIVGGNTAQFFRLDQCTLALGNTHASSAIMFVNVSAANPSAAELVNVSIEFSSTGQDINVRSRVHWQGGGLAGLVPTSLFTSGSSAGNINISGVDLSALGAGSTLVGAGNSSVKYTLNNCKLGSNVTVAATPTGPNYQIDLIRCDSGDTNYRNERFRYSGTLTTETTIVRTGGASDGTTPFAWKLITTANAEWTNPLEGFPITIWNETTGSAITLTIEGVWDAGAVPNDEDIWLEAEYLGTSGFPVSSFANDGKATILTTTTAQTSSSETWTTTGLATPVKFKLAVTVTPQEKGPITLTVKAAKVSSTFYIDPKVTVT